MNARRIGNWLAVPFLFLLGAASHIYPRTNPPPGSASLVLVHGKVYTENPEQPWAEAVAIKGDKILAVGSNAEIAAYLGPSTRTIDAHSLVVLPGFTDSHIHFLEGALSLDEPDLNNANSIADIEKLLKSYAASHPGKGWVVGQGWSYDAFGMAALPNKKLLDAIFSDRPVYLESFDGHSGWTNSTALAMAGITRATSNPPDGTIVRDPATGEATGALKEQARHLVKNLVPMPTPQQKLAAYRIGFAMANQFGIVRAIAAGEPPDTFGDFYDADLLDQLRRKGQLSVRFYISKDIEPPELTAADLSALESARKTYSDEWISVGAAKFFMDGVIEAHTAAMLAPYSDEPNSSGSTNWLEDKYNQAVIELDRRRFQIFTHAVGDRAVRIALDAYQQASTKNGTTDQRHRIEHIETISAPDIPRLASLGVIASMQPLHAYPVEGVWGRATGPEREKLAFAWNSIQKAGGHLAFGSDWEVVTMNPWPGVQTAVTRQNDKGWPEGGWIPDQRISVSQAIAGYTMGAAYSAHREKTEGSLEPGKVADLIIISQNPFEIDPHELAKTEVELTMVGGRVVYQNKSRSAKREGTKSQP